MTPLQSVAMLLTFAALGGYINCRWMKLPGPIGTTVTSVGLAILLLIGGRWGWFPLSHLSSAVRAFDLQGVFLHGILSLMLFAGALFVDWGRLKRWAGPITSLATLGVLVSAIATAGALYGLAHLLGVPLPFVWCVLFGALIAPTDPIGALAIIQRLNAPKDMEIKLVGESLFNDGTGVMFFLILLGALSTASPSHLLLDLARELLWAPAGGALLGFILGMVVIRALAKVDDYPVEILLTLALATGTYGLAEAIHASAPIAVVVAGLVVGTRGRAHVMSEQTRDHLDSFWKTLDELLNAALFALIGLELLTMDVGIKEALFGVLAWGCVVLGRGLGVALPLLPFRRRIARGTLPLLTWGGLRGGISLALALSLPASPYTQTLVAITFVVVVLSSVGQGLTLGPFVRRAHAFKRLEHQRKAQAENDSGPPSAF